VYNKRHGYTDRDDIPALQVERFLPLLLELEEEGQTLTPCVTHGGINYMYIKYNNLYRMRAP
jgi:AP-1 complex subunit mu